MDFSPRDHAMSSASPTRTPIWSEVLKDNLDLPLLGLERMRAEHQIEVFYDLHITPFLQLTGDLQIIRPNRPGTDTAIVPGGRLRRLLSSRQVLTDGG